MSRALRYACVADLPPALRARVELAATRQRNQAAADARPPKPRRDEEHEQQVVLINRIRTLALNDNRYAVPARRTVAVPNGSGRSKRDAGRLKAEGVTKGVSDIFVSLPSRQHDGSLAHGLYIEMKSTKGRTSPEQDGWLTDSRALGYAARVCRSADEAFDVWKHYVDRGL